MEMSKKLLEVLSSRDEKRQQVRSLVQALHQSLVVEDEEIKVGPFPPEPRRSKMHWRSGGMSPCLVALSAGQFWGV